MKRTVYIDGWHDRDGWSFYVENGCLMRGVLGGDTPVYPYKPSCYGGFDNVSGITARYGVLRKVYWF